MTSTAADLQEKIASLTKDLSNTQRTRSESRARNGTPSKHSPTSSNVSNPIPEGEEETDGRGGAGTAGVAPTEGTRETATAASKARSTSGGQSIPTGTGTTTKDDSSDEDDNAGPSGAPVSRQAPPAAGSRPNHPTPNPPDQAQPQAGQRAQAQDTSILRDLDANQRALMTELQEINGQDSYDALAAGIGKLKRNEYLAIPSNLNVTIISPKDVGKPRAHQYLRVQDWADIYALNKARAPEGVDAKVFALLRMEAVKCGWLSEQREVVRMTTLPNSLRTLAADMADLRDRAATIKTAAFLVPLVAEHVFRTYGHHFITTDAANYTARYRDTFRSCLAPEIDGLLAPAALYHSALHWVSPGRARQVLMAQIGTTQIPDALSIRANAAPAGTAILTTTVAILNSMAAVGLDNLFATHGRFDIDGMRAVTDMIKEDPCRFHKSYFAYGLPPPPAESVATIERMKEEGIRFAPFAQAYINTYMRDAALGRAQALKKHAEQNPIQMRRAQNLFRAINRNDVTSVAELFATGVARSDLD